MQTNNNGYGALKYFFYLLDFNLNTNGIIRRNKAEKYIIVYFAALLSIQ